MRIYVWIAMLVALMLLAAGCAAHLGREPVPAQPYAGLQDRQIRALAPERVDDLLAGRGAGYALAAELNQYPGPRHVLDMAGDLRLSTEQKQTVAGLFGAMEREARQIGKDLVDLERRLDEAFRSGGITAAELERLTGEIAAVEARLRFTHLAAHLQVKEVLNAQQIALYDQLRGYVDGGGGHGGNHGGH